MTFFCIKILCINPKRAWQPLLPSAKGLSFALCFLLYAWVKVMLTFPFFILSFGKILMFKRSWYIYIYIQLDVSWHRLLLLTTPKDEYVGRQHNKPLSISVSGWNSRTTSIAWVLAIVEDYEIVEYVSLLKSSSIDSFWCYDKLQLLQWLRL